MGATMSGIIEEFSNVRKPEFHGRNLCAGQMNLFVSLNKTDVAKAKAICKQCPVKDACLEYGIRLPWDTIGVYGGKGTYTLRPLRSKDRKENKIVEAEKKRIKYGKLVSDIPHGTYSGYIRHKQLRVDPCDECKQANAQYMADYRTKKKAKG
jgi:hypothetical protein